jgi:hypothetical protein
LAGIEHLVSLRVTVIFSKPKHRQSSYLRRQPRDVSWRPRPRTERGFSLNRPRRQQCCLYGSLDSEIRFKASTWRTADSDGAE